MCTIPVAKYAKRFNNQQKSQKSSPATPDISNAKYHFNQTKRYEMCNTAHIVYDFSQSTQTFGELIAVIFKSQSLSLCGLVILGAYNSQYSIRSLIPDTNFDTFCTSKQHKYKQCLCFGFCCRLPCLCFATDFSHKKCISLRVYLTRFVEIIHSPHYSFAVSLCLSISFAPPAAFALCVCTSGYHRHSLYHHIKLLRPLSFALA